MRRGCQKQLETFSSITFKNRFKKRRHWMLSKSSIIWNNGFPFPWFAVLIPAPQSSHAWTEVAFLEKWMSKILTMSYRHRKVQYVIRSIAKCRRSQFLDNYLASQPGTRALPAVQCLLFCARRVIGSKTELSGVTNPPQIEYIGL